MASDVDLVNDALLLLGEPTILSLTDDMDVARTCNGLYPRSRDWVLAAHPWNRCVKQVALTQTAAVPLMTYTYQYLYPSDAIRILIPDDDRDVWEVGATDTTHGVVWTNHQNPIVRYIFRNPVVESYSAWLRETISAYLAFKLCYPLTDHRAKAADMKEFYLFTLGQAKMLDGQEQSPQVLASTVLTDDVRNGG